MSNKPKIRFNAIDLFIIIAFIGCIVGLALRYKLIDFINDSNNQNNALISFRVTNVQKPSEDFISLGDKFFLKEGTNVSNLGAVSEFHSSPAEVYNFDADGNYILGTKDDDEKRIDVTGKLIASGLFSNEGFLANDTKYIAPGGEFTVFSDKIEFTLIITDIEEYTE